MRPLFILYQLVGTLSLMQGFSSAAIGLALIAGVIYLWLRAVARNRNTPALARAKSHSFWCALIAFFASTSTPDQPFWSIAADGSTQWPAENIWFSVLSPALWLGTVYLIGLYSWPRELKSVRSASLEPRSLTTPVPRRLLVTACLLAALSIASLWPMLSQPGFVPVPAIETVVAGELLSTDDQQGIMPGREAIAYTALQIIALMTSMAMIALVILRRSPLNGISHHDNQVLRATWLNRLLRTGGFLLAVAAVENLSFVVATPLGMGVHGVEPDSQWMMASNIFMLAVSAVMFFWGPKANFEGEPRRAACYAFGRARDHLLVMAFVATLVALLSVFLSSAAVEYVADEVDRWSRPIIGEHALATMFTLLVAALAYLLITCSLTAYGHLMAGAARQLPRLASRLPTYIYCVAGVVGTTGIVLLFAPPHDPHAMLVTAKTWETLAVVSALAAAVVGAIWWVRRCAVPWKLNAEEEIWYRQVLELRILRTSSSALLLMPTWAYDLGPAMVAIGLIPCCIPSMVVLNKPTASIPYRQPA
ncbi:hypothetical protein GCM10010038_28500 [Glutamicibacter protophormiae]|nr:hypothetical protein GCM10010038_28500 [Glutamicibacter protophormiae]